MTPSLKHHPKASKVALAALITTAVIFSTSVLVLSPFESFRIFAFFLSFWGIFIIACSSYAFVNVWKSRDSWVAWIAAGLGALEIAAIISLAIPTGGIIGGGSGKYVVTGNDFIVGYFDALREGRVPRPISYVELHPSIKYSASSYRPCIVVMSRNFIMVQIDKRTRVFYDVSWGSLVDGSRHFDFKESHREKDSDPYFFELVEK